MLAKKEERAFDRLPQPASVTFPTVSATGIFSLMTRRRRHLRNI